MSELDQLDSLSNAALRAKCLEHGLPNVPVTDSSRKILIKKLRLLLSDPSAAPTKVNRRETIDGAKPMTPVKKAPTTAGEERGTPNRNSRRTIAAPTAAAITKPSATTVLPMVNIDDKVEEQPAPITGRRASAAQKTATQSATEESVKKTVSAEPAPITERRRSVRERESVGKTAPPPPTAAANRPQTISENEEYIEPPRPTERRTSAMREAVQQTTPTKKSKPLLEAGSFVILESDEEEEEDDYLVRAMEQAEKQTTVQKPVTPSRKSRVASLGKVSGATAYFEPAADQPKQQNVNLGFAQPYSGTSSIRNFGDSQPYAGVQRSSYSSVQSTREPLDYSGTLYNSSFPTTTTYSSPAMRYRAAAASTYKPSRFVNEQSDENELDGEELNTPFLSSFARNLERIKAETLTATPANVGSARYRGSKFYDDVAARGDKRAGNSANGFWNALARKYHLKFFFAVLIVVLILIFFYILFFN